MATYNGERFLAEQLDSIAAQTHTSWRLIVSDDGSTDDTLGILKAYQKRWGADKIELRSGPCQGFAINFLTLATDNEIKADLYAFCDQDDVWLPTKLAVAVEWFESLDNITPNAYCGRTHYVTEQLKSPGLSPHFVFPRSFRNALVQSIAGGNTMVFNQAVKNLIEFAGLVDVVSHDWWLYIVVAAVGGRVYYDEVPQILYRQHPGALVGANDSTIARFDRIFWLIQGRFRDWNDRNIVALDLVRPLMIEGNLEILNQFVRLRRSHIIHRFRMIEVCGLYLQDWRGTLSLYLAALFNRV